MIILPIGSFRTPIAPSWQVVPKDHRRASRPGRPRGSARTPSPTSWNRRGSSRRPLRPRVHHAGRGSTVQLIEKGDPSAGVGRMFEAAVLVGLDLLGMTATRVAFANQPPVDDRLG